MVEISEAAALERGTYAMEEDPVLRRYRLVFRGSESELCYVDWRDPSQPLADLQGRNVEATIESPVEKLPGGGSKWRTWYVDARGTVTKQMEHELDEAGRAAVVRSFTADGVLTSYSVYHYTTWGELVEVVSHNPDGTVRNVHAAPL
jgi:hypothetical protein